ncbi:MAG TPA: hypothetical protein VFM55_22750 [Micromonosporaceae bacterium]|nr:hypothetical protein [Micromonosporaceae bacterium]
MGLLVVHNAVVDLAAQAAVDHGIDHDRVSFTRCWLHTPQPEHRQRLRARTTLARSISLTASPAWRPSWA